jgi:acyl-CoA thioesterase-2
VAVEASGSAGDGLGPDDEAATEFTEASLSELIAAIEARPADAGVDAFLTDSPDWWWGGRTFGGMVVAQALNAASRTVDADLVLHSLHGYFLRPSPAGCTALHSVARTRDGRSFAVREVRSEVKGQDTFALTCSFHRPEPGDEYQLAIDPDIPPPAEVPPMAGGGAFEVRDLGPTARRTDGTYLSTRRCWFRTREALPDDPALHACVLAYLSDMTGAAFRPHSLDQWGGYTDASLDHALWFHRPCRADRWNLFDNQALVNSAGRSTIRAVVYDEVGSLCLSMAQELLIRALD